VSRARIRGATLRDVDRIVELGAGMHAESRYAAFPYDREIAARLAVSHISDGVERCCIVSEVDGSVTGMIGGEITPLMFSRTRVAHDTIFYIEPASRGRFDAFRLVRAFESWAKAQGAAEITLATSTGLAVERSDAFFQRLGYGKVGSVYSKPC
jgi:GNAT superfamily N-acetyltransferase